MQNKNILLILPDLQKNGPSKEMAVLAEHFGKNNKVTLMYLEDTDDFSRYNGFPDACKIVKVPSVTTAKNNIFTKIRRFVTRMNFIRKFKKENNIDVSISFLMSACLLNVLTKSGIVVCSERNNPAKALTSSMFLSKAVYFMSDLVVFQSRRVMNMFGYMTKKHSVIIHNPISISCFAEEERNHEIVTAGRLEAQKNHELLIRAFYDFSVTHPGYVLRIYGDGSLRPKLEKIIRELDLQNQVFLMGHSDNIHKDIKNAEIFALSSDYEGLSNALLEAMAMGIACVSTACEGSDEIIEDKKNGLLVEVGNKDQLGNALTILADNKQLRKQIENNAKRQMERLTGDQTLKEWESAIEAHLPKKKKGMRHHAK